MDRQKAWGQGVQRRASRAGRAAAGWEKTVLVRAPLQADPEHLRQIAAHRRIGCDAVEQRPDPEHQQRKSDKAFYVDHARSPVAVLSPASPLGGPLARLRRRFARPPHLALMETAARLGYLARGAVYLSVHHNVLDQMRAELPPEVLTQKARETIARLGYEGRPADSFYDFDYDSDFQNYVEKHDQPRPQWDQIVRSRPSARRC